MYHRIVVPLDGSAFSEHALPYAALVAGRSRAQVDLVLVHTGYGVITMDTAIHETVERWQSEQRVREANYLQGVAGQLRQMCGLVAEPVLLTGSVAAALCEYAGAVDADVVVMTTHGRGGLERAWLGSVADEVVRHVHLPVLLVRPSDEEPLLGEPRPLFRHVGVALDGSALAEHSLQSVLALADPETVITLIRVVTPGPGAPSPHVPAALHLRQQLAVEREAEATDYLRRLVSRIGALHARVDSVVLADAHAATAIVRWADQQGADGIALSSHGRAPALRLLLGSVTDRVVRSGRVPVLVG